ncbi:hypothetical protein BT69DRAFT_1278272 [Atractiella rhizophila]|nr:hypothetical protein BT69DRAFT_1278272 [Atractiella rhizophila]
MGELCSRDLEKGDLKRASEAASSYTHRSQLIRLLWRKNEPGAVHPVDKRGFKIWKDGPQQSGGQREEAEHVGARGSRFHALRSPR